jgi:hypothetical protein
MVNTILDSDILKVTSAEDGVIWYLEGSGMPHYSGVDAATFLESSIFRTAACVRVIGTASNARLILQLYGHKLNNVLRSLEVCSPLCCESAEDRRDPEVTLYNMRSFTAPGSLGGWHEFGPKDIFSYTLAAHFHTTDKVGDDQRKMMALHPAWPALSFVAGVDQDACAQLIGTLIDPRWYIDTDDPDRCSKLEQFLGLNPVVQGELEHKNQERHRNYRVVLKCWKNGSPPGRLQDLTPRHFLWRAWHSKTGGHKGDLVASKFFVSYLRAVWTDAICAGTKAGRLFVPEYFFLRPDEAKAYRAHVEKMRK